MNIAQHRVAIAETSGTSRLARRAAASPARGVPTRVARIALFVLLTCALVARATTAQTPDDDLRAAEERLASALSARDAAAFAQLLADDFVLRGAPDVERATWITNAVGMCWGERVDVSDVAVRSHDGDTAVVTLVMTTYQDPVTCEPAILRSLLTDIWTRQPGVTSGGWRLTLRHAGPAGDTVSQQFARTKPPPPRWERSAELSLVGTGGNTATQTLGVGGSILWRPGTWVTQARTAYVRSSNASVDTAESLVIDLRQSHQVSERLDIHGSAAYLADRFAGIDHRTTIDAGVGWLAFDAASQSLKLDVGAGVTNEVRLAADDLTFPVGTLGVLYRWQLSRTSVFTQQALVTADLGDAANWRLQNSANLTVTFTRLLSFKLGHELRRNNQPVPGFRTTDTVVSAALVARF